MSVTILSTILAAFLAVQVHSFGLGVFQEIYREYKKQGIPFREDPWLGNKQIYETYDFIVVGAGPGGATVAGRLSEVEDWNVLVLEAGKDESIYTDIPALASYLFFTDYNWGYTSEKRDNQCLGSKDQRCVWPRGKGMGGGSIINYMIYTRGNRKDFDDYEKAGNTGWGWDDVLPYYLKSEKTSIRKFKDSPNHSTTGKLHVGYAPYKSELLDSFLEAGRELGYDEVDYTNSTPIGVSRVQTTILKSRRCSASKAYLKPVKHRRNLHVSIESRVTKVLIDPTTKKAIGVEFVKNRKRRTVMARKEVILAAGALNTPQLLMLSGVGPREHLEELGIKPVIQNLRVGENLNEHWTFAGLTFLVNETGLTINEERANDLLLFKDWFVDHKGPLSLCGGVEGLGYISTKHNKIPKHPDIELIFASGSILSGDTLRRSLGISDEFFNEVYGPVIGRDSWTILPMILHPKSRGRLRLKDKNPWHWPVFEHDYFQSEDDARVLVEGIKAAVKFAETRAFKRFGSRLFEMRIPGCPHAFGTDEYWRCALKYLMYTLHHQSGTCKMGPRSDPTAVVNPQLQVHGIQSLRVCDSSIFPQLPTAHTYAPTVMVGEKLADMIKEAWGVETTTGMSTFPTDQVTESHFNNFVNSTSNYG